MLGKHVTMEYKLKDKAPMQRCEKAWVGVVEIPCSTYNIQNMLSIKGCFLAIKVIPLGANMCLLEEMEKGEFSNILESDGEWLKKWFKEIMSWKTNDVDMERLTWLRA